MISLQNIRDAIRRPPQWHTPNADCGCCAAGQFVVVTHNIYIRDSDGHFANVTAFRGSDGVELWHAYLGKRDGTDDFRFACRPIIDDDGNTYVSWIAPTGNIIDELEGSSLRGGVTKINKSGVIQWHYEIPEDSLFGLGGHGSPLPAFNLAGIDFDMEYDEAFPQGTLVFAHQAYDEAHHYILTRLELTSGSLLDKYGILDCGEDPENFWSSYATVLSGLKIDTEGNIFFSTNENTSGIVKWDRDGAFVGKASAIARNELVYDAGLNNIYGLRPANSGLPDWDDGTRLVMQRVDADTLSVTATMWRADPTFVDIDISNGGFNEDERTNDSLFHPITCAWNPTRGTVLAGCVFHNDDDPLDGDGSDIVASGLSIDGSMESTDYYFALPLLLGEDQFLSWSLIGVAHDDVANESFWIQGGGKLIDEHLLYKRTGAGGAVWSAFPGDTVGSAVRPYSIACKTCDECPKTPSDPGGEEENCETCDDFTLGLIIEGVEHDPLDLDPCDCETINNPPLTGIQCLAYQGDCVWEMTITLEEECDFGHEVLVTATIGGSNLSVVFSAGATQLAVYGANGFSVLDCETNVWEMELAEGSNGCLWPATIYAITSHGPCGEAV